MKLLVFDGNSIINRAYYAIRGLMTKDGFATNGIYGFLKLYEKYFDLVKPDLVAVTFDLRAKTFRHKMYDEYKAQRKGMPEDLAAQMEPLKSILRAMNVCILEKEGYEADDLIGTLAAFASKKQYECYIVSGDRDDFQLVNEYTTLLLPVTQKGSSETVTVTPRYIFDKYGLNPAQMIELKAIMGDTSDNIKGVPGIGEKGALDLILRFGSLDGVYENIDSDQIKKGVREKLIVGREMAYLSHKLAQICCEVPVDISEELLAVREADGKALSDLLLQYELTSLLKILGVSETVEKPIVKLYSDVSLDECAEYCRENGMYFTYSISENGIAGNVVYQDGICEFSDILPLLTDEWIRKITFDAKALYTYLLDRDMAPYEPYYDVMVAQYVLDSTMSGYGQKNVLNRVLQREAETDAEFTSAMPELYRWQQEKIEERGQRELLYNIEFPLTLVLADMERVGFKVDRQRLLEYSEKITKKTAELVCRIIELAGEEFNVNSPKQLGLILFEKLQLKPAKKTKSGYSTNVDALEKVAQAHPIVPMVLEYRKYAKLKSTYCDGLLNLLDDEQKIHTSFQQTVTHTGRISSTEPNLQNIPVRTDIGRELRAMFVASDEDKILVDADYSQIELRVLAHIANDENMLEGFRQGADIHTSTAARVFDVPIENVTESMRRAAKAVNFGIVYGISDFSLAQDIHVTKKEAKAYIENYLAEYSGVKRYMEETVAFGKEHGYVRTIFGRRRELPELSSSNFVMRSFGERVAMNTPIQGSAADIIKIAMVNIFNRMKNEGLAAKLILQVHDELIIEAPKSEMDVVCRLLSEEMENAAQLKVRLIADVHCGESWYDCK